MTRRPRTALALLGVLTTALTVAAGAPPSAGAAVPPALPVPALPVPPAPVPALPVPDAPVPGGVRHPLLLQVMGARPDGSPLVTSSTATGYTPAQVRAYLGLTGTGSGQTIAVVTAYDAPAAAVDLATFDTGFGLPAPPSFRKVDQSGGTRFPAVDAGWALETALDVQWAHAVAPAASILLVEASSSALVNLLTAVTWASKAPGVSVISNSYGTAEYARQADQDYRCRLTTALCVFASGDDGNPGLYPASSPWVLSVGGTRLGLDAAGTVTSETAWSGSGGGVSLYAAKPAYQSGLAAPRRSFPDVSYDADPATGFAVYSSTPYGGQSGWFQMGGTSAGAPQWAGVLAAADQLRKAAGKPPLVAVGPTGAPSFHTALYGRPALADVLSGTNGTCAAACTAGPGYDTVTGFGSPRAGLDAVLRDY